MAMKQGATRQEIEGRLLFTCVYAGFNNADGAFGMLKQVLWRKPAARVRSESAPLRIASEVWK